MNHYTLCSLKRLLLLQFVLFPALFFGQFQNNIEATLLPDEHILDIRQTILFTNTSKDTLSDIYFNDWANSFSNKRTALARRFAEYYQRSFHLAKPEDRGATTINNIKYENQELNFDRPKNQVDILHVMLKEALLPEASINLTLSYSVKLPDAKFTNFGFKEDGDFNLRYWYLSPAVYQDGWQYYSHKNLDDLYMAPTDFDITLHLPSEYHILSPFEQTEINPTTINLKGTGLKDATLLVRKIQDFQNYVTNNVEVQTNITENNVLPEMEVIILQRIMTYLEDKLGEYPHHQMLLSQLDYKANPVYGLNQLPSFLSPFPSEFLLELKLLKSTINEYVDNTFFFNPRTDYWLKEGLKIYLIMKYMDTYYPNLKVLGKLEKYWIVQQFNMSRVEFNDQFNLLYLNMARLNIDQPLTMSFDSLIKYNANIANAYKAGSGLNYLDKYINKETVDQSIKEFYANNTMKLTSSKAFEEILRSKTEEDVDWFFGDYIKTDKKIDYKIQSLRKKGDSVYVKIKNKRDNPAPILLYGKRKNQVLTKEWIDGFKGEKKIAIADSTIDQVVLNQEGIVPEFNRRDNYKKINPLFGINRPYNFKLFQDIEDPSKNQIFIMPSFEYNLYDGLKFGARMYNKTLLAKAFNYKIEPQYGTKSNEITGSFRFYYNQLIDEGTLDMIRVGIGAGMSAYAPDAFYKTISPYLVFSFRPEDLRSDKRQYLSISNINVRRDESDLIVNDDPNYSVFNVKYANSSPGVLKSINWDVDFQLAKKFSKAAITGKYKKIFLSNRQVDLRVFAGTFIYNDSRSEGNYFSFALDRPTDYLFRYNYYGRSESTGLFSQQLVLAEGGFKSKLQNNYSNTWMATLNGSTTLWNFIHAYGDVGIVNNKNRSSQLMFDSGIRAMLVEDYFELFFPIYSSNGWEVGQQHYEQKIRFVVTLQLKTLLNLVKRKWY